MTTNLARPGVLALLCLAAAGLTGCAANSNLQPANLQSPDLQATGAVAYAPAAGTAQNGQQADYVLTSQESEFDCKRLAGKLQIRILEMRANMQPQEFSALSKSLQTAFAGTPNPQGSRFAQLDAYNRQLADKNCRSFDLAKALAGNDVPPSPTVPPRAAR